jgi:hypothetical protein
VHPPKFTVDAIKEQATFDPYSSRDTLLPKHVRYRDGVIVRKPVTTSQAFGWRPPLEAPNGMGLVSNDYGYGRGSYNLKAMWNDSHL